MKLARFLGLAVILTGMSFIASAADSADSADGGKAKIQYVEVKKHLSNVYVTLNDPKSEIITQVKKGERIQLLRTSLGGSWYEVKVEGKVGYMEARNGKVVNSPGEKSIMLLLFIVVLLAGVCGVVLWMKKQQIVPSKSAMNDLDDDDLD